MLSIISIVAVAAIALSLYFAWSKKFLATGALVIANIFVALLSAFSARVNLVYDGQVVATRSLIQHELGLHGDWLAAGNWQGIMQLITSMFVHADFFHLLGNLIVLLAFALPFEERIGPRKFILLYLLSGLAGAFSQLALNWGAPIVMMGASGAVFGIIGAFAGAYPRLVLPLPLPLGLFIIFVRMKVMTAAMVFGGLQILYLQFLSPFDNTAYMAHIGGLAGGIILVMTLFRPKDGPRAPQSAKIDLEKMRPFARNLPAQNALARLAMSMDEPELAKAWMEKFLEHATCPEGAARLQLEGHNFVCADGHKTDIRA